MLACSFLIKSSSKLLVNRTGIKARSSSILGRIRPLILELLALEWRKFHTFRTWISLKPVGQSWSNFMCSMIGVGGRLHKVLGQIDFAHWTQVNDRCPLGYLLCIFSANTLQPVQKSLCNWIATRLECSWQAAVYISHVWRWKSLNLCCLSKLFDIFNFYQTI